MTRCTRASRFTITARGSGCTFGACGTINAGWSRWSCLGKDLADAEAQ